ncbi:MAG: nucleoside deaminase [Mollicutes bacterium]|nr:nucleoside deaminase [Mollicutes bacterium]MDD7263819.1 nucleoside deaminase [bacterium]MDY4979986.1 nucleoside deaminase [Candidatus Onthovivens sp.]
MNKDEEIMSIAIKEANLAFLEGEIPVGAVIVDKNYNIISKAHNKKEKLNDVTAHAEILAIKEAVKVTNSWRLNDYKIYVTMEPCLMCTSAILQSRIKEIIYGVDSKFNELSLTYLSDYLFDNGISIKHNILNNEINNLMNKFFQRIR